MTKDEPAGREGSAVRQTEAPRLPAPPPEGGGRAPGEDDAVLRDAARFHRGDPGAGATLARPDERFLPALLFQVRDPSRVRFDYPLLLPPVDDPDDPDDPPDPPDPDDQGGSAASRAAGGAACRPLADLLPALCDRFAPGADGARILRDNLPRLERRVRDGLAREAAPADAAAMLEEAGRALEDELALRAPSAARLHEDLRHLREELPAGARLLGPGEDAALHLFVHAARRRGRRARAALRAEAQEIRRRLLDLLRVDREKNRDGRRPGSVAAAVGAAGAARLDPERLSSLLDRARGPAPMDAARRKRIEGVLATLDRHLAGEAAEPITIVHGGEVPATWREDGVVFREARDESVCRTASLVFDELAAQAARLLAAIRVGRLEVAGTYDPARHDGLLEVFDWESFARDELLTLPPVLAVESEDALAGAGMLELSRLLRSGRPVNVMVAVHPVGNPGAAPGDDPLAGFRLELAYVGISHREAYVTQSSAARPEHLLACFREGLEATTAALHVVASGLTAAGETPRLGGWLHAGAALEGRAHPFVRYDPQAGATWARRLDFAGNPAPEDDWPEYQLMCRGADGAEATLALRFTFADFVLLEPRCRDHFRVLPDACAADVLIDLADALALPADAARDRLPFIWGADANGDLHRLLVSRRLAAACRDRLDYWRTLQELAGVRNEHVREAVERERARLETSFAAERAALEDAHAAAMEAARRDGAGDAMERLARALLRADLSAVTGLAEAAAFGAAAGGPAAPAPPAVEPRASEAAAAPAPAAEPAEEEEPVAAEPWIDTPLCTSCNDCLNINRQMFVYDGNKQAVIGDPRAGTYAQLVQAAEKCPARCIHPGLPLNPDEPDLEGLLERAKGFN